MAWRSLLVAHSETSRLLHQHFDGSGEPLAQEARMLRVQEVQQKARYFASPAKLFSSQEISADPMIVPAAKGTYRWYFDVLPPGVPTARYVTIRGHMLLYIGIAGATPSSRSTLRKRICSNHPGRHSTPQSTLRRTLGALLKEQRRLVRQPKGQQKYWFGPDGEARLRQWMIGHTWLAWHEDDAPREIEATILSSDDFVLPLNKLH